MYTKCKCVSIKLQYTFEFVDIKIQFLQYFSVYKEAVDAAKEYAKTKGPGTQAKPEQHQFFRRLATIIQRTLEKCERENGLM